MWERRRVVRALEALKVASEELLQQHQLLDSPSLRALLELESKSQHLLSGDPDLSCLSLLLSRLRDFSQFPRPASRARGGGVLPFSSSNSGTISSTLTSISSEIQAWIDRESLSHLSTALLQTNFHDNEEDEILDLLTTVESRIADGFDQDLQSAILRYDLFQALESALTSHSSILSKPTKNACASVVAAVVRFNRDVFVSRVIVGPSLSSFVVMATPATMRALHALLSAIGTPLVDVMDTRGEIPSVVRLLREAPEEEVAALAVEVVMEIGFYGRKETVDGLVGSNVVENLVALQRTHQTLGFGIGVGEGEDKERGVPAGGVLLLTGPTKEEGWRPFLGCVARFALRVDLGEGMGRKEKSQFRVELMRRLRAITSDADAAYIIAEVLWGTAP